MAELYIGLMSGTSVDGIDAVLVDFSKPKLELLATLYTPYAETLRQEILALCSNGPNEIERLATLDITLGKVFAQAANTLLQQQGLSSKDIRAIGSHGQTIRHMPKQTIPFTLQIGDANTIAAETGITTIADFRRRDIAHGGQGAPLVPAFHNMLFKHSTNRAIVNIGGISNVTLLSPTNNNAIIGFDTGPGNTLLDSWIFQHQQLRQDANGAWGAQGKVIPSLLNALLSDPYFQQAPPKSSGREYFNLQWLNNYLKQEKNPTAIDVQATLTELTAQTIVTEIKKHQQHSEILVCGGGTHNQFLISRLQTLATPNFTVKSTAEYGLHPDWIEAIAFAWLAKQTLNKQPGNLPSVTGATKATILGGVYYS